MKNLTSKVLLLSLALVTLLNSGCATIFGKSSYPVSINSSPAAASITVTNRSGLEVFKGATPATVDLKSSNGYFSRGIYQVKFHLDGYQDKTITIESKLNGWYIGNLLIGGALGMLIIDPLTGAMYKINDTQINETLAPSTHAQASNLEIIDINSLPQSSIKRLIKIN